jgi:hypothetical protein
MQDRFATPPYHVTQEGRRIAVHALDNGAEKTLAVGWAVPFKEGEMEATFRLFARSPQLLAEGRLLLLYLESLGLAHQPAVTAFAEAVKDAAPAAEEDGQ